METTASKPFFITRFFRWLFSWRIMRRLLLTFVTLITFWALFHAEENWRGQRAWQKYKAAFEAKGARFDLAAFVPKPVPDEQNFAATPFFKILFPRPSMGFDSSAWSSNSATAERIITYTNQSRGDRHLVDLPAWEKAFAAVASGKKQSDGVEFQTDALNAASRSKAAPAVLAGLREGESVFEELRTASVRPYSRYSIQYNLEKPSEILLPHLAVLKGVVRQLQLKACAELVFDNRADALADMKLMIRLADSMQDEPFLISWLVRLACFHIIIHPVWEGLAEHRWTDAELQELQNWLQSLNFLNELNKTFDGERGFNLQNVEMMAAGKFRLSDLNIGWCGTRDNTITAMLQDWAVHYFLPRRGWFALEKINLCQMYELELKTGFDAEGKRVFPERIKNGGANEDMLFEGAEFSFEHFLEHRLFAERLMQALQKSSVRAASAQIAADQANIACALERYRLAKGDFPENLDVLAPQFMAQVPHDVLTGEPYHYHRAHKTDFVLYSVGWNGKDDGGTPGKSLWDNESGDWVWRYPAKP